ncbi:hypothetical protein BGZ93_004741 [Podila epicladia]|nr:hypothetical protein BGZ92_009657 [Podila epicladia]KAG0096302.1 hypothetical protein BGZ93_004741 [Podila epicladia]
MSLFHSKPVTVQRTYYKPSVMSRLKAMFTPSHHHRHHYPRTTATAPRTTRRTVAPTPRRRVYGAGLFHRTPRRRVAVAPTRRGHVSTKARIMAALRPRRHTRATRTAPVRTRYGHGHHYHRNGSKVAALLGLIRRPHHSRY